MRVLKKDLIAKVAKLEGDLMELALNPNSERSLIIQIQQRQKGSTERLLWFGDVATRQTFDGLLNQIKQKTVLTNLQINEEDNV